MSIGPTPNEDAQLARFVKAARAGTAVQLDTARKAPDADLLAFIAEKTRGVARQTEEERQYSEAETAAWNRMTTAEQTAAAAGDEKALRVWENLTIHEEADANS